MSHSTKVFVHGVPETSAVWSPLVDELSTRGVTNIVLLSPPAGERICKVNKTSNMSVAAIQISVGEGLTNGRTAFTYHFGYANAPSRHKLHHFAIVSSEQTTVFT
jgi:hypothetical protein